MGAWVDATGTEHGYSYIGNTFAVIDFPLSKGTEALGINKFGVIVGDWTDASSKAHGYILHNGQFTSLDFPGAVSTIAFGVNDAGVVAGYYTDASNNQHGFLYQKSYSTVDVAGAANTLLVRIKQETRLPWSKISPTAS